METYQYTDNRYSYQITTAADNDTDFIDTQYTPAKLQKNHR